MAAQDPEPGYPDLWGGRWPSSVLNRKEIWVKSRQNSPWLILAIIVVTLIALGGQTVRLTCTRIEPGAPVNCVKQTSLLWTIPLGEEEIRDVRGADVAGSDDATYRVELLTARGTVPFTFGYTSGGSSKRDAADRINAFVLATKDKKVVIAEPGLFGVENFLCLLIWLPLAVAWHLWRNTKYTLIAQKRETSPAGPMVSCPYCGSSIPKDAIDCVHCRREVYDALHKK